MKSRELYHLIIGFLLALIIFRIMEGDWATVTALLVGLSPFYSGFKTQSRR